MNNLPLKAINELIRPDFDIPCPYVAISECGYEIKELYWSGFPNEKIDCLRIDVEDDVENFKIYEVDMDKHSLSFGMPIFEIIGNLYLTVS